MPLGRAQRATARFVELYLNDLPLALSLALLEYRHFRGTLRVCYSVLQRFWIPITRPPRYERSRKGNSSNDREQNACNVLHHFVHIPVCLEDLVGVKAQRWRKEGVHCDVGSLQESHDGVELVVVVAAIVFIFFE